VKDICPSFVMDRFSRIWLELLFPAVAIMLFVGPLVAQRRSSSFEETSSFTLAVGSLRYQPSANTEFRMLALRFDRGTSPWMRFETSASYSRPDVQTDSIGAYDPSGFPKEKTHLYTITVGANVRWELGRVEPYGGLAFGIFGRRDGDEDGRRFSRTAFAFPFGIRVRLTDNLGIRGEVRFREDGHEVVTHSNREMTVGLAWTR